MAKRQVLVLRTERDSGTLGSWYGALTCPLHPYQRLAFITDSDLRGVIIAGMTGPRQAKICYPDAEELTPKLAALFRK